MYNLSQGIKEKSEARGQARMILNMHKKGYTTAKVVSILLVGWMAVTVVHLEITQLKKQPAGKSVFIIQVCSSFV